jgi:alkylmercury lyase-like protein
MALRIATLDELIDADADARIRARHAARRGEVMRAVLRLFAERGAPVTRATIASALPHHAAETVGEAVSALEADDLLVLRGDTVTFAYPFAAAPSAWTVRWPDGRERHACCAIDALGMAPMLGHAVHVSSRCHHSGAPLELAVGPSGPGAGSAGVMVWISPRPEGTSCVADSL